MDFLFTYQRRFARWLLAMMLVCAGLAAPAFAATQTPFSPDETPYSCLGSDGVTPGICVEEAEVDPGMLAESEQPLVVPSAVFEGFLDDVKHAPAWKTITSPVSEVPLPMAGWLLVSALGGLGLFGKRRRDAFPSLRKGAELEPLQSALRGSTGPAAPEAPVVTRRLRPVELLSRLSLGLRMPGGPCAAAFAPECAGLVRSGGAENRYAIAEDRAPPSGRSWDLVGPALSAGPHRVRRIPFDSCRSVATGLQLFFMVPPSGPAGGYSASNTKNGNTRIIPRAGFRRQAPALHYQPTNNQELTT